MADTSKPAPSSMIDGASPQPNTSKHIKDRPADQSSSGPKQGGK